MYIPPKKFIPIALISLFIIASCGKKSSPTPSTPKKTGTVVYVAGNIRTFNGTPAAVYWRNGVEIALADSSGVNSSNATGMVISDTDVYICGNVNQRAVYWKNGKVVTIGIGGSYANGMAVIGNDVYVAGESFISVGSGPVYWKNGNMVALDAGGSVTFADAITAVGSDVYVAGNSYSSGGQIVYWKNGVLAPVAYASSCFDISYITGYYDGWVNIAVSGSDVYITGATPGFLTATYWKNNVPVYQLDHPIETSVLNNITINGSDVYVAGFYNFDAVYWKNGTLTILPSGAQPGYAASAIAISGSDVYVAGFGSGYPTGSGVYWKNGTLVPLSGNTLITTGIGVVTY